MMDAANFDQVEALKNGTPVRVRSMKPSVSGGTVHVCLSLTADMISISEGREEP